MANQKQIKKRVSSIKNIGKITSALEMVSASKVQKAQDKALAAKPYADKVYELIQAFSEEKEAGDLPLLRQPSIIKKDLYVLISSNKGLAGSLNTSLFSALGKYLKESRASHYFVTVGVKGRNLALKNGELLADFSTERFEDHIAPLSKLIIDQFSGNAVDSVYLVYNNFETVITQTPQVKRLLPIVREDKDTRPASYSFEPSASEVLESLLIFYIENQIRDAVFEAEASEHAARMIAMKNASDNAKELAQTLSLDYNNARQQAITNEIADVVTSTLSLN